MSLYTFHHDAPTVAKAFRTWVEKDLISDKSVFSDLDLATPANFDALNTHFVQQPDAGEGLFYEKLRGQLSSAPPAAAKLMAEVLWALFLFPSNITPETKRSGIIGTWELSGDHLDPNHALLTDQALDGVGSGGMGVNTNRWRELNYIIGLCRQVKKIPMQDRSAIFGDYERFMEWMNSVPTEGNRQFRHMVRYFLFPDRVERMSTNNDRVRVLAAWGIAKPKVLRKWTDRQLDDAMFTLRSEMEDKYQTKDLDFYLPPLNEVWQSTESSGDGIEIEAEGEAGGTIAEPGESYSATPVRPRNLILYGPPGTGKTYRLQQLFASYTDQPADLDRATWELGLLARFGWRSAIAAALASIGKPVRVADLENHPIIKAKKQERQRATSVRPTLWGYLQEHTPLSVDTVNTSIRRAPYIFTKNADSEWTLVSDWSSVDGDSEDLWKEWQAGPSSNTKPDQRYRVVTFHPNYSYEDFVIGLRPVVGDPDAESAPTEFRMVDGVFKQICAKAKSNPGKRYALFIDEINRAHIAKVFGELITLVESDKRAVYDADGKLISGMEVQLPGTPTDGAEHLRFGVPANLDIFGTMNTADRSIALLDIALRRRFDFEHMAPNYAVLGLRIEGVDLGKLLKRINDRLEFLGDRDRLIGHAYFMKVKSLDALKDCFRQQIIPLLQEYFFDDWGRVALVLSDSTGSCPFLVTTKLEPLDLFPSGAWNHDRGRLRLELRPHATWVAADFRSLYEDAKSTEETA